MTDLAEPINGRHFPNAAPQIGPPDAPASADSILTGELRLVQEDGGSPTTLVAGSAPPCAVPRRRPLQRDTATAPDLLSYISSGAV